MVHWIQNFVLSGGLISESCFDKGVDAYGLKYKKIQQGKMWWDNISYEAVESYRPSRVLDVPEIYYNS